MLVHLSDIVSQTGKTENMEVPVTVDVIKSELGSFKIAEKSPLHLQIINTGNKVLELTCDEVGS